MPKIKKIYHRKHGLLLLKDGRYQVGIWFQGRYHRYKFPTKSAAKAFSIEARGQVQNGTFAPKFKSQRMPAEPEPPSQAAWLSNPAKTPFEAAAERFLERGRTRLRQKTFKDDEAFVRLWLAYPGFAGRLVADIKIRDIESYQSYRSKSLHRGIKTGTPRCISKRSVDKELARLRSLFNLCIKDEVCDKNPVSGVDFYHDDNRRRRVLSPQEESMMFSVADPFLKKYLLISLKTGMRAGDVLSLQWKQIDFDRNCIHLESTKTKNKTMRGIAMHKDVRELLQGLPRGSDEEMVLPTPGAKPFNRLMSCWRKAVKLTGITQITPHTLRKTVATRLAMQHFSPFVVKDLLGHQSVSTTERYAFMDIEEGQKAVDAL